MTVSLFRLLALMLVVFQLVWFFSPWESHTAPTPRGPEAENIGSVLLSVALTVTYLVSYLGICFFQDWARRLLLSVVVLGSISIPIHGLTTQSGLESLTGYLLSLGEGFMLGIAYFSILAHRFSRLKRG